MSRTEKKIQLFCINYPPEKTGIAPYTGGLAKGLAKAGYDIRVVTTQPHYPAWSIAEGYKKWFSRSRNHRISLERVFHFVPAKPTSVSRLLSELSFGIRASLRRKSASDCFVLVTPALFASALVLLTVKLLNKKTPVIVWVQDLYAIGLEETGRGSGLSFRVTQKVEKWLLSQATKIIVIHRGFAEQLIKNYGVDQERIKVIANWNHVLEASTFDRDLERSKYSWDPDELIVLHTGNMGHKQGLLNVVDAAMLADSTSHKIKFVLCGDGVERQSLERSAEGIRKIQFLKTVDEMSYPKLLMSADILLVNELLGVQEMSVPSKLTSYFQAGKPIIGATTEGGNTSKEILNSGAGTVISSGEPHLLLRAAVNLFENKDLMVRLSKNGKTYAASHLEEKAAIANFVSELEELL
jgi:glycosyltransferase involved in cell wall biosynthesis